MRSPGNERRRPQCLRLFFFVSMLHLAGADNAAAQATVQPWRAEIRGSIEYLDLLRQQTDRYRAITLGRRRSAEISLSDDIDSVFVAFEASDLYAALSAESQHYAVAIHPDRRVLRIGWARSMGAWEWTSALLFPAHRSLLRPLGEVGIRLNPWAHTFDTEIRLSTGAAVQSFGASLYDFTADTRDEQSSWSASLRNAVRLSTSWSGSLEIGRSRAQIRQGPVGYSTRGENDTWNGAAALMWRIDDDRTFEISASYAEASVAGGLSVDDQSFGAAPAGRLFFRSATAHVRTVVGNRPTDLEAGALSANGKWVGAVESWPFTPIAATVFSNRLNLRASGSLTGAWCDVTSTWATGVWQFRPGGRFIQLWCDGEVAHWEPEYLVFGIKNYALERLRFTSVLLLELHMTVRVPWNRTAFIAEAVQLAPLRVGLRSASGSGAASGSSPRISTDGGRRVRLAIEWRPF